ncbi:MAG: enoyl-ACP reductase [Nitrospirae bacterium]|nr:enoyl-ACP reductase [Nitrospirota bacterium]MCL5285589.1 enoyl-ACP reductase [Nitrospirota bacterium]
MTPPSSGILSSASSLLSGRHILVTGVANRWSIAWAVVQSVVKNGGRVTLTYQGESQKDSIAKLMEELPEENRSSLLLPLDVRNDGEVAKVAERLRSEGLTLDGLVHSIAFAKREELDGAFLDTSREGFLMAQEISAYSLVVLCRAFAPLMASGASIVAMTYLGSERIVPHYNVMGAAKAALEASVRYLAYDLGSSGIRVNAVSAGPIKTASGRAIKGFIDMQKAVAARAPLKGQDLTSEEVADATAALLSPLMRAVTGEVLFVDLGYRQMGMV